MDLDMLISGVKGVGPKTSAALKEAGVQTVRDLLYYLPRDYEDYSRCGKINDIRPGRVIVRAKVEDIRTTRKRRGLAITEAKLVDGSGAMRAVWFNQPYRATQFKDGKEYYFAGQYELSYGRYQLMNPSAELASEYDERLDRLVPVYRSMGGLKSKNIQKIIKELRGVIAGVPENLPEFTRVGLVNRGEALYFMHFPESLEEVRRGRHRLAFEELFELVLAAKLNKLENQKLQAKQIKFDLLAVKEFIAALPFKLTNAQRRVVWEIVQDFEKAVPMNRLLQGDVGSGKTVVAGLAAYQAAKAGIQTALMAPTEILAVQHAETLDKLLSPFGLAVGLLTGSVKNKTELKQRIASGEVSVVVGTHALLTDDTKFKNLGFVVIDEQHRFGVKQRQKLSSKAGGSRLALMPHLLSMSATPIPRSLQLTLFGEMDISILGELPKGRKNVITQIVSPNSVEQMLNKVYGEIKNGRQIYYICPMIDENGDDDLKNVKREYDHLRRFFDGEKVGLLHGKMKPAEKEAVMAEFGAGKVQVLVSTTVVEVGVDVPNATVIIIRDADRFGLSQLHQLRGRVGRGEYQSYCYLVMSTSAKPTRRLQEIEKSNDGFYLAEKDLELRGPGEIYGSMQHGVLDLKIATVTDVKLVAAASKVAEEFVKSGENLLKYPELAENVQKYQKLTTLN